MASVSSLDKDLQRLRLSKYTQSGANEVLEWIVEVLGLPPPSTKDLMEFLKDGTVLCSLVSPLLNTPLRPRKSNMPFVQMENIALFLTAISQPPISLPPPDLFLTVDLYENKDPAQVVQTLNAFSRVANRLKPSVYPTAIGGRTNSAISPQSSGSPYTPNRTFPRSHTYGAPQSPAKPASLMSHKSQLNRAETTGSNLGGGGLVPKPPTPLWNVIQYGGPGGASQGDLGISLGGVRQITSPAPTVPSLRQKEEQRKREEEARRKREQDEAARREEEERRLAEEARLKAEEDAWIRQQEEAMRLQEEEERRAEEERRLWEMEENARRKREELRMEEERIAELKRRKDEERRREQMAREEEKRRAEERIQREYEAQQRQREEELARQEQERHEEARRLAAIEKEERIREAQLARERERQERERLNDNETTYSSQDSFAGFGNEDIDKSRERERLRIAELERELQRARERERQYVEVKENQRRAEVEQRRREAAELVQRPLRTGDRSLRPHRTGERQPSAEMIPSRTGDRERVPKELWSQRTGELRSQRTGELRSQRTGERNHFIRSHRTGEKDVLVKHRTGDRGEREIIQIADEHAPVQTPMYSGQNNGNGGIVRSHKTGGSIRDRHREEREAETLFLQDAYNRYRSNGSGYEDIDVDQLEPIPQRALPTPPRKPQNLGQPALPPRQPSPSRPLPDPANYQQKQSQPEERPLPKPAPSTQLSPSRIGPIKPRWGGSSFLEREREKERQRQKEWEREQLEREDGDYGINSRRGVGGPRGPRT